MLQGKHMGGLLLQCLAGCYTHTQPDCGVGNDVEVQVADGNDSPSEYHL